MLTSDILAPDHATTAAPDCNVIELRQYTLHPGQRDVLIDLFEREFLAPLEAAGMTVMGQFHDLDRPDRFVWMRGFADMPGRARSLAAFYGGTVWQQHRDAANATMIDSDNVLLLRPARPANALALGETVRRAPAAVAGTGRVAVFVSALRQRADARRLVLFDAAIAPALAAAGARVLGHYVTETHANTYPRLPVREGEHVSAWFTAYPNEAVARESLARLDASALWRAAIEQWNDGLVAPIERLRLAPTLRSRLGAMA